MKVLLLGDYSNCHRTLATGLRRLGCDVTVASDGTLWMQTERDVDTRRRYDGKAGGLLHYINMADLFGRRIGGYDIVSFCAPTFLTLKPERLRSLFDMVRRRNGRMMYTAMSTDLPYLDMLADPAGPLQYSEWYLEGGHPAPLMLADAAQWQKWHSPAMTNYQNYFFDHIEGAVSVLYEYHLAMERRLGAGRVAYGGIPIVTADYEPVAMSEQPATVRLFLGRHRARSMEKGGELLEQAARRVMACHPGRAELTVVENRPLAEFNAMLRNSHVVLDQIYSYTPATTALMAMAYGLNVVSGGEDDYYRFIGEDTLRPIINAPTDIDTLEAVIEDTIMRPELLRERSRQGRLLVERHNDVDVVARRFLDFWSK